MIIGGPHIRGNNLNAYKNYAREAKDPLMTNYIVNQSKEANRMASITFSLDDAQGVHYPRCTFVVKVVVA